MFEKYSPSTRTSVIAAKEVAKLTRRELNKISLTEGLTSNPYEIRIADDGCIHLHQHRRLSSVFSADYVLKMTYHFHLNNLLNEIEERATKLLMENLNRFDCKNSYLGTGPIFKLKMPAGFYDFSAAMPDKYTENTKIIGLLEQAYRMLAQSSPQLYRYGTNGITFNKQTCQEIVALEMDLRNNYVGISRVDKIPNYQLCTILCKILGYNLTISMVDVYSFSRFIYRKRMLPEFKNMVVRSMRVIMEVFHEISYLERDKSGGPAQMMRIRRTGDIYMRCMRIIEKSKKARAPLYLFGILGRACTVEWQPGKVINISKNGNIPYADEFSMGTGTRLPALEKLFDKLIKQLDNDTKALEARMVNAE